MAVGQSRDDDTHFDNLGRADRTVQWEVAPDTGAAGNSLVDNSWFDLEGCCIGSMLAARETALTEAMFFVDSWATHTICRDHMEVRTDITAVIANA